MEETEKLLLQTEKTAERSAVLERMIAAPEIIADNRYWRKLVAEKEALSGILCLREKLFAVNKERTECVEQLSLEKDGEIKKMLLSEIATLVEEEENLRLDLSRALATKQGEENAVLELVPGGNKGNDFCDILRDVLIRRAERTGLGVNVNKDKGAILLYIAGAGAYAYAQGETGVHKFLTDEGTFTVTATALPLRKKEDFSLPEKDLRIDLFHSGGAGGQNINKVETAVRITHVPTGIVVTCQDERSQLMNKRRALETLKKRLEKDREKKVVATEDALRKKASSSVVCAYNLIVGTVTRADGKYDLQEYMTGRKKV